MEMETIRKSIKNLGKADFDKLVMCVLRSYLKFQPINVDGRGDGGLDVTFFEDEARNGIAVQVTVQQQNWRNKIVNDIAGKIKRKTSFVRFYAFVNVECEEKTKADVEGEIFNKYSLMARIFTVRELASMVQDGDLIRDLTAIIADDCCNAVSVQMNFPSRLLNTYFVLGGEGKDLQNEIVDNTLLFELEEKGSQTKSEVIEAVVEMLQLKDTDEILLVKRIDSLMMRGFIEKDEKSEKLQLTPRVAGDLRFADMSYQQDIKVFEGKCKKVINAYGGEIKTNLVDEIAGCLARCFLQSQLSAIKAASLELRMSGFSRSLNEAEDTLIVLLKECGIDNLEKAEQARLALVNCAANDELIKKFLSATVYACLRDVTHSCAAIILNVKSWKEVAVYLDASVAIPYLVSSEFGKSDYRFSRVALSVVGICSKLGVKKLIPRQYLEECATHLISAGNYCGAYDGLETDFAYSRNGYVSHYYQLKMQNAPNLPSTLAAYIRALSPSALSTTSATQIQKSRVMADLLALFAEYEIQQDVDEGSQDAGNMKEVSTRYSHILQKNEKSRSDIQICHDVEVMSALWASERSVGGNKILLTWDSSLIELANEIRCRSWVVNPVVAADLIQASRRFSDAQYLSLGHSLARVMRKKCDIVGRFVDRMVELCGDKLMGNNVYRERFFTIKASIADRCVDLTDNQCLQEFDKELSLIGLELKDGMNVSDVK